jgi:hypothetical protein
VSFLLTVMLLLSEESSTVRGFRPTVLSQSAALGLITKQLLNLDVEVADGFNVRQTQDLVVVLSIAHMCLVLLTTPHVLNDNDRQLTYSRV